ncbi:hypothetical protein [Usitatibacter palustris]|uniref:hypothetical protein n=1 Tax=Usitatibacter palustris TaxID=2732487 RepID=UPI001FE8B0B1
MGLLGGLNTYAYGNGNPIVNFDVEGTDVNQRVDLSQDLGASVPSRAQVVLGSSR